MTDTTILIIVSIIAAYFIGSIPTSIWIGKIFFKKDIREIGSGNAGATNSFRAFGWKTGVFVLLFDSFKGWAAVMLAGILMKEAPFELIANVKTFSAVAAVIGHIFPLYANFNGGKGVATLLGVGVALFPWQILIAVGVFLIVFFCTKIISVSSISAGICFPFIVWFLPCAKQPTLVMLLFAITAALLIVITHKKNIVRILNGEEKKLILKKKDCSE